MYHLGLDLQSQTVMTDICDRNSQSNQLTVPFRKSTQISLSTAIRQYISKKYDQHPDMFQHDLEVIESLRREAVNVREAHISGIKKLQVYAGQIVWMSGKFPIDVSALAVATLHMTCGWTDICLYGRLAPTSHGTLP